MALVICSVGRPDSIEALLPWIARLSPAPDRTVFVVTTPKDIPDLSQFPDAEVLYSEKGLTRQRNKGLDLVQKDSDAVFFIDDDYIPAKSAISGICSAMSTWPDAAGFSGQLLADGIHTGGVSVEEAATLIAAHEANEALFPPKALKREMVGLYGCNMAYRSSAIGSTRFDERLPLYGWQEDVDFSSRLLGEKIRVSSLVGVHCGTTQGRETKGHLLGYSQIANVVYLMKKGSLPFLFALRLIAKSFLANHARMFRPEEWIDRKGRARGNWLALRDVARGLVDPERILKM